MSAILAIDPGPTESASVLFEDGRVVWAKKEPNQKLLTLLQYGTGADDAQVVIEQIRSYGMAVGAEVFDTVLWSGRFAQAWEQADPKHHQPVQFLPRLLVKQHLCHDSRAKDANIRQALIDRLGPPGTKKFPGPTAGIHGDMWAALAVAVTAADAI